MKKRLAEAIIVLISLSAVSPVLAGGYTWDTDKGTEGSWTDASHWSPSSSYPNGPDDGAFIDNSLDEVSNVSYTASVGSSVNWINLYANTITFTNPLADPDRLNLYGSLSLVPSTSNDPPLLANDGIVYLDGSLQFQEAPLEDNYGEITGAGVLRLGSNGSLSGTFLNGPSHVIEGRGRIGFEGAGPVILNRGVIRSNLGTLQVSGKIVNTPGFGGPAVLRGDADSGSLLYFDGATIEGGSIEAADGPVTMVASTLSNLTISNGMLRVIGTTFQSTIGHDITIAADADLRLQGDLGTNSMPKLWVRDDHLANPITIDNNGTISLDGLYTDGSAEMRISVPSDQSAHYVTLAGSGTLLLGLTECPDECYDSNLLSADPGAGFIQSANHSIRGYGTISAPLINLGRVTAANDGTLKLQEDVTNTDLSDPDWQNQPFGTLAATPDAKLLFTADAHIRFGQLEPEGGTIAFNNALVQQTSWGPGTYEVYSNGVLQFADVNTLDADAVLSVAAPYGGSTKLEIYGGTGLELVNNGRIAMDKSTELRQLGNEFAILSGSGTLGLGVTAGYGGTTVSGDAPANGGENKGFINNFDHTIRGAALFFTNLINKGELIVENGFFTFFDPFELSGTGNVTVNNDGTLSWSGDLGAHNFTLNTTAVLWPNSSDATLVLSGNFSFFQTDENLWVGGGQTRNHSLTMASRFGALQTVEVGGTDLGAVFTGFYGYGDHNFDLTTFTVSGTSTRVQLVDDIDNGNRTLPEALYARTLSVLPDTTLDLNGLAFYTLLDGNVHRVREGEGDLFGGGTIIDSRGSKGWLPAIYLLLLSSE
jgi:hypothetical protein